MVEFKDLEGKKIKKAYIEGIKDCDDIPYLYLEMEDGTKFCISADYGRWTGKSNEEYPRFIEIFKEE